MAVAALGGSLQGQETAVEFVRFCRDRRRVAWPEIYDEMCAVARRRLFRGWGLDELADHGVEFGLFQLPALADTTRRVLLEEEAAARSAEATARCHEAAARCPEAGHATVTPAA